MDSFHAAIQISTPLTDSAWEVLKPRLIAQRELGEEREKARIAAEKAAEARLEEKKQEEAMLKQAKESADRDWDEKQSPIRDLLTEFAAETIKNDWDDGKSISKDNCTKFAADVLLYVRKRFYEQIAAEDRAAREAGEPIKQDPATGPPTRKLVLENMKWVYDTKIKSLTESFRKELFLCHDCDSNTKFYGFEGVIQHFAAKHTNLLSVGSIVVHWRAEWPEHSPFHPDPTSFKPAYHPLGQSQNGQQYGHSSYQSPGSGQQATPSTGQPFAGPVVVPPSHETYSGGPRPSKYQDRHSGYPPNQSIYEPGHASYRYGPSPAYHGHQNLYPAATSYLDYPPYEHGPPPHHAYPPSGNDYGRPAPPLRERKYREPYLPFEPGPPHNDPHRPEVIGPITAGIEPPVDPHTFKQHLEVMAAFAREIWTTVNSVKDIPTSVKFYVLIYHVVTRVRTRYGYEPGLDMFTEGIENQHLMRPIKHATVAVGCRTCLADAKDPRYAQYGPPPILERMYQLPSLLRHFRTSHINGSDQPVYGFPPQLPDWTQDMVDLPEEAVVSALIQAPGMDDQKLRLLADAFPQSFPNPLPRIGVLGGNSSSIVPPAVSYNGPQDPSFGASFSYNASPVTPADVRGSHREPGSQNYMGTNYEAGSIGYDPSQSIDANGHAYRDNRSQNVQANTLASDVRLAHQQRPASNGPRATHDPNRSAEITMEREPSYDPRHSDLVFASKGTQARPASRSNLGRRSREPHMTDEGSEDGEVGPISASAHGLTRNDIQIEGQLAADQFFQNFEKDKSRSNLVSSARNDPAANTTPRSNWLKAQDPADPNSRVSAESYDEYTRNSRNRDGSLGHTPVFREHSWNETETSTAAVVGSTREYNLDGRLPRNSRGFIEGDRYAERQDPIPAISRSSHYQKYVIEPGAAAHDYGDRYRYEPSNHDQYSGRPRSPRPGSSIRNGEAYQNRKHDHQSRSGRYGADYRVRASPAPASYVPEDLKHSLQIPTSSSERAYVEDPRHTSSYGAEYVRVATRPEDVRGGYIVGPPAEHSSSAEYAQYEDTRGRSVYVEHPAYPADVRLYEREDPRYGSRRVKYG